MPSRFLQRRHRVAAILLGAPVLLLLLSFALVESHVHRIYGGYVARVDPAQFASPPETIAITEVSILSPDGESMQTGRTVIIDEGRVVSTARDATIPQGARRVDGRGKYLIPGLIDTHVHLRRQPNDLLLYVANGVTHVRDLAGSRSDLALREEIENGRIGPRLSVSSPQLFTAGLIKGWFSERTGSRLNVGDATRAKSLVRELRDAGYDAVKTYSDLDLDTYRAINRAAAELGLHTVGHLPDGLTLDALGSTGQSEIAHIEEIVKALQDEFFAEDRGAYRDEFHRFVAGRADAVIDDLLANDITVNSSLWLMEVVGQQAYRLEQTLRRLPLEYANPAMLEGSPYTKDVGWLPGRNKFEASPGASEDERRRVEAAWEARAEAHRILARRMAERRVSIVAGTDATSHLVIPGFSIHDELQSLARNGMTPAQALRAATAAPAALLNSDDGVIEAGRRANLVLLSANPLVDIANTTTIEAVVLNGGLLDRARLDAMLEAVREANAASRKFDLARYQ